MLPEKTWKTESVLRLLLEVFGTLCIGVLLASAVTNLTPFWPASATGLASMVIITMAFHGSALVWIRLFLRAEKASWGDAFGFNSPQRFRAIGLGVLSGILVLPVAWGLQQLSAWLLTAIHFNPAPQQVVQEIQKEGVLPVQQIYLAFVALIAAPIVEEMLFRGILYPTIKRAGYPKLALWITAILFALMHRNLAAFIPLLFFAMILTSLYEDTGNLLAPIVAHGCFNTANFVLLLWGKDMLDWGKRFFNF